MTTNSPSGISVEYNSTPGSNVLTESPNCAIITSAEPKKNLDRYLLIYIANPVILIGIVTSLLSFAMFMKDRFTPKTTKLMLKTMALVDALFLFLAIGYIQLKVVYIVFPHTKTALGPIREHPYFENPLTVLINICEMYRNWLTVMIGVERYLVTCHPLKANKICTKKRSVLGMLFCLVFTIVLRIPITIRRSTMKSNDSKLSTTALTIHSHIDAIFLTILPVIILGVGSVQIMRALKSSRALICQTGKRELSKSQKRKFKVTRMLTVVLIIFSLTGMPNVVYNIIDQLPPKWICNEIFRVFTTICWFMSMTYSTTNFFVYVIYMPKYRQILRRMLCCQRAPAPDFNSTMRRYDDGNTSVRQTLGTAVARKKSRAEQIQLIGSSKVDNRSTTGHDKQSPREVITLYVTRV